MPQPSDAIWTIPNVLTFIRLGLTPLFLWFALAERNIGAAFATAFIGFVTDLADGKIARHFGSISRLGILLDPLADRLALAAGAAVLIVHDLAPLAIVLAILVRDLALVLIGVPILRARGIPIPPVTRLGKRASFAVTVLVGLYTAAAIPGIETPWATVRSIGDVFAFIAIPLYYASAAGYVRAGLAGSAVGERG
jgi:cardiolipin synthase (CMP-forming)